MLIGQPKLLSKPCKPSGITIHINDVDAGTTMLITFYLSVDNPIIL